MNQNTRINKAIVISTSLLVAGLAQANLVVNGSFETGPVGQLATPSVDGVTGWRAFDVANPDKVSFFLVNDANEATDGNNYIRIVSTAQADPVMDTGFDITYNGAGEISLVAGVEYTLSFDARIAAGTSNKAFFQYTQL